MERKLSSEDQLCIEEGIRRKYAKVSVNPEGLFRYPTGRAGMEALKYDKKILRDLPETAVVSYCGVGNPFTLGPVQRGEKVLDIGCGGGVDTLVAGILVGSEGSAVGIDMVGEMVDRAKENLRRTALANVAFQEASGEKMPFSDESFDVVISNGVFNLIPDKAGAWREVFGVLKPGGRVMIADNVLSGELPKETKDIVEAWAR
jgi:arsenite methyltransferase